MPTGLPKYDGTDGGPIDLTTARQWVKNFRATIPPAEVRSHYFGRDIVDTILAQPGCTGLRIYYAINDKKEKEIIISGADDTGEDMLPGEGAEGSGGNTLADASYPCPSVCPTGGL